MTRIQNIKYIDFKSIGITNKNNSSSWNTVSLFEKIDHVPIQLIFLGDVTNINPPNSPSDLRQFIRFIEDTKQFYINFFVFKIYVTNRPIIFNTWFINYKKQPIDLLEICINMSAVITLDTNKVLPYAQIFHNHTLPLIKRDFYRTEIPISEISWSINYFGNNKNSYHSNQSFENLKEDNPKYNDRIIRRESDKKIKKKRVKRRIKEDNEEEEFVPRLPAYIIPTKVSSTIKKEKEEEETETELDEEDDEIEEGEIIESKINSESDKESSDFEEAKKPDNEIYSNFEDKIRRIKFLEAINTELQQQIEQERKMKEELQNKLLVLKNLFN